MRDIKFRCWYDNYMHKVLDIDFRHKFINLLGADIIKFDEGILMQYTGLTDKNGKKIFEGDIVLINNKHTDEVIFECGCFLMKKQLFDYEFTYQNFDNLEVIGNIYENKELLGD